MDSQTRGALLEDCQEKKYDIPENTSFQNQITQEAVDQATLNGLKRALHKISQIDIL